MGVWGKKRQKRWAFCFWAKRSDGLTPLTEFGGADGRISRELRVSEP